MGQCVLHRRLQVTELAAAIEALAFEAMCVYRFARQEPRDPIRELDLPARPTAQLAQLIEYAWRQHVAADDRKGRGRYCRLGLLDDAADAAHRHARVVYLHDPVPVGVTA